MDTSAEKSGTGVYISVSMPAYNEVGNIRRVIGEVVDHLEELDRPFEIVLVNDGSVDGTGELADSMAGSLDCLRVVHHPENRGYGAALRSGFDASRGELVCLFPSDGQFDIKELDRLLERIGEADIVAGYRMDRQDPPHRKLNEFLYNFLIRILFGLRVRDVDCGFKLYQSRVLKAIDLRSEGALIDAELFARAKKKGFTILQVGVHHYPRVAGEQSGANLKVILKMFSELFKLYSWIRN